MSRVDALVIGAGIFGVAFGVIRPIAEMTDVMKGLAGGDLIYAVYSAVTEVFFMVLAGDPLELQTFGATGATMDERISERS